MVDTVEQAQACIEHLRKNNIGRASFMVLEKLSRIPAKPAQTPENIPRLFDLIKPKESKFAPALYKAVQDTLVAQDLTQANRIAYREKRKVVTLAGDLIEAFGTMSGGGKQVSRGGMSSKFAPDVVSPEVLRNYQKESDDAEAKLKEAQEQHRSIESELEALIRSGPEIEISLQKVNMDVQNITKAIAESERRLRELSYVSRRRSFTVMELTGTLVPKTKLAPPTNLESLPSMQPSRLRLGNSRRSAIEPQESRVRSRRWRRRSWRSVVRGF